MKEMSLDPVPSTMDEEAALKMRIDTDAAVSTSMISSKEKETTPPVMKIQKDSANSGTIVSVTKDPVPVYNKNYGENSYRSRNPVLGSDSRIYSMQAGARKKQGLEHGR